MLKGGLTMNVSNTTIHYFKTPNIEQDNAKEKLSDSFSLPIKNDSNLVQESQRSINIWEELSTEYNVRNASFDEISNISYKLYQSGEISLGEHAILSFDYDRATNDIIRRTTNSGIYVSPNFSIYATEVKENGKRDWIAEYELRVNRDFKSNNMLGYHNNKKILNILNKLAQ